MTIRQKIYLASPYGFSHAGRDFMYSRLIPIVQEAGFAVLDPWKLTPQEIIQQVIDMPFGAEKRDAWQKVNRIIGSNNANAIKEAAGLLAMLDGTDVDSGTASEIGYAAALGKRILGYRGDFRLAGDNEGSIVNLQVEYFISSSGGKIVTSIDQIGSEMRRLFR